MNSSVPDLHGVWLTRRSGRPLLVVGSSLGTSVVPVWQRCAGLLEDDVDVLAWELPGHGGAPAAAHGFTMGGLAGGVAALVDREVAVGARFVHAGVSIGGAVGLQLMLDVPSRVVASAALCTGAMINLPEMWRARARTVREQGTAHLVADSPLKWFGEEYVQRRPDVVEPLVATLADVDREGYAQLCDALALYDVRDRLHEVVGPVLAVAGGADVPTPVDKLEEIAVGVGQGELVVLGGVGHLATVEAPVMVADLLRDRLLSW